jgi:hypothetical protein
MSIKLTDTQLIVLSAAAQREDRCLVATKSLKGGAAQKCAAKLLAAGLVKKVKAKPGMPAWRRDEPALWDRCRAGEPARQTHDRRKRVL